MEEAISALHSAAKSGQTSDVQAILRKGADVNGVDLNGETALHKAAASNRLPVVTLLLEQRANAAARSNDGDTALHWAARGDYLEVSKLLVEHGADVKAKNVQMRTPIDMAKPKLRSDLNEWAKAPRADKRGSISHPPTNDDVPSPRGNRSPSGDAVLIDISPPSRVASPALLPIKHSPGSSVPTSPLRPHEPAPAPVPVQPQPVRPAASSSQTLPLLASSRANEALLLRHCKHGNIVEVQDLLVQRTDVNARDPNGDSCLHKAARGGHRALCQLLIDQAASPLAASDDGFTALHFATFKGKDDICALLLTAHANVNAATADGMTPLHVAAVQNAAGLCSMLVEFKADVAARSRDVGWTALHDSAFRDSRAVCKQLVAAKADIEAKSDTGQSPLQVASERGNRKMVRLLLELGAAPDPSCTVQPQAEADSDPRIVLNS